MRLDPLTGTLVLTRGDSLADVPESHLPRLTAAARTLFADPPAYFARLAAGCPFPRMAHWLASVAADRGGELHLYSRYVQDTFGFSGYLACPTEMHPVLYHPPLEPGDADLSDAPADIQAYYRLVNSRCWGDPGHGGLTGAFDIMPLELADGFDPAATGLSGQSTWDWGATAAGDTLWFTDDGRAGKLRWEPSAVEPLGTIAEAIDWVFAELAAGRAPA